jgi:hypothetical protein
MTPIVNLISDLASRRKGFGIEAAQSKKKVPLL